MLPKPTPTPPPKPARNRVFRGRSAEERREERRARLIEAGIAAFGTHGYHAVTVRELCAEARLTERYFYESFENLEQLFVAVFGQLNAQLRQAMLQAIMSAPREPITMAEAALTVFFEFIRDDPKRARIILVEAPSISSDMLELAESTTYGFSEMLRGFLLMVAPSPETFGVSATLLSHGIVGSDVYIATKWVREGFATPIEDVIKSAMTIYRAMFEYAKAVGAVGPSSTLGAPTAKSTRDK